MTDHDVVPPGSAPSLEEMRVNAEQRWYAMKARLSPRQRQDRGCAARAMLRIVTHMIERERESQGA